MLLSRWGLAITLLLALLADSGRANPTVVKAFREGMAEGMTATHANLDEARAITSKYLKLPVEIVASVEMPPFNTEVTPDALARWIAIMKSQDMLTSPVNADKLVMN